MKNFTKILSTWLLAAGVVIILFGAISLPLLLFRFDDILSEKISDRTYTANDYKIRELIYHRSSWPDNIYERIYTLDRGWKSIELGRFRNEDNLSVVQKNAVAKMVGKWLVIMSANRIFLWQPDRDPIEFEPYRSQGWSEYAEKNDNINGHYDYHAVNFSIQGDRWLLEYRCEQTCVDKFDRQSRPAKIMFESRDRGQTFQILTATSSPIDLSN
jgi:hypothetical protein